MVNHNQEDGMLITYKSERECEIISTQVCSSLQFVSVAIYTTITYILRLKTLCGSQYDLRSFVRRILKESLVRKVTIFHNLSHNFQIFETQYLKYNSI
jgi:hypothetical protein